MPDAHWSNGEKKIAHTVFDAALQAELDELMAVFKVRAAAARVPDDIWRLRDWLHLRQREIDTGYDFRYSQLIFVFAQLVARGRVSLQQLDGLSADKLEEIAALAGRRRL